MDQKEIPWAIIGGIKSERLYAGVLHSGGERHIGAEVDAPDAKASPIDIIPLREATNGREEFSGLIEAERGAARRRAVPGEIEQVNIVLMFLQGGGESENVGALRTVSVTKDYRGTVQQAREEPSFARPAGGHIKLEDRRMAHQERDVHVRRAARRLENLVEQIAGHGRKRQQNEKYKSQERTDGLSGARVLIFRHSFPALNGECESRAHQARQCLG